MDVGDKVKIEGLNEVYVVCGSCPQHGVWLSVDEDEYDGYDHDVVVFEESPGVWGVRLSDERSSIPRPVRLTVI